MKARLTKPIRWSAPIARLTVAAALLAAPAGSRADTIYVSNYGHNNIMRYTPDGYGSVFAGTGQYPYGIAFDGAGNLYVAVTGAIQKLAPDGTASTFATIAQPTGLAFDAAGNLYAVNLYANTIDKYTPDGSHSIFASGGIRYAFGLAFDPAGNLYAASWGNNTIVKFTPGGVGSVFASTGSGGPIGLAFDRAGSLYATYSKGNSIVKFTTAGVGSVFANTGLNAPQGLAFDSVGNLYVANYSGNSIQKFTPDGVGSVFASAAGLFGPEYIAIQIPEPSTWALLALAFPALLAFRRP